MHDWRNWNVAHVAPRENAPKRIPSWAPTAASKHIQYSNICTQLVVSCLVTQSRLFYYLFFALINSSSAVELMSLNPRHEQMPHKRRIPLSSKSLSLSLSCPWKLLLGVGNVVCCCFLSRCFIYLFILKYIIYINPSLATAGIVGRMVGWCTAAVSRGEHRLPRETLRTAPFTTRLEYACCLCVCVRAHACVRACECDAKIQPMT